MNIFFATDGPIIFHFQVKTELVASSWRDNLSATPEDIAQKVHEIFAEPVAPDELNRRNELLQAAVNPTLRIRIDRMVDDRAALQGIHRFATNAMQSMGPSLLQVVNDDINKGKYYPGSNFTQIRAPTTAPEDNSLPEAIRSVQGLPQRGLDFLSRVPQNRSMLPPNTEAGPSAMLLDAVRLLGQLVPGIKQEISPAREKKFLARSKSPRDLNDEGRRKASW